MRLSVPTNWESDLVEKIKNPEVTILYGKLSRDCVGGGRASCVLNNVERKNAVTHIEEIHKQGWKFHYVLNASCTGNREWTRAGQNELNGLLDWLLKAKVDGIIISNPYILQHIKKSYPCFEISVSCFANVNSVDKALFWQNLGASTITLSHIEVNRNFKLLKEIRRKVSCCLQVIVNDSCIQDCPIFFYHNNVSSHASQTSFPLNRFMFDFCYLMCRYKRIVDTSFFIRGTWIRPEDTKYYEDIGIDYFKLTDRTMHTDAIALIVDAYSNRSYNGNLYDLFVSPSKSLWRKKTKIFHMFKYFFHPFSVNILKLVKKKELSKDMDVYIDNTKLDGFIEHFFNEDCRYKSCLECGYCLKFAEKVVTMDEEFRKKAMHDYGKFLDEIISGTIFRYLK